MEAGQIEYIGEEKARDAEVWSDSARVEGFKSRRVGESEGAAVTGIVLAAISWLACSILGRVGIHPAVFVRVASKGVTGYETWKSV
jgi:hypothetical protein